MLPYCFKGLPLSGFSGLDYSMKNFPPSQTVLVLAAKRDFKAKSWQPVAGDGEVAIHSNWIGSKLHSKSVSINALV